MNCPHCHKPITIHIGKPHPQLGPGWDYGHPSTFETTTPYTGPVNDFSGPIEATRTQPARPASVESDVVVPLLQSLASGIATAIPAIGLTIWLQWPWYSPLLVGGATVTIAWLSLLGAHRRLLWLVESVSNLVEGNPEPQPKAQPVSLEVKHEEAGRINKMQYVDMPSGVSQDLLISWAITIVNGIKSPAQSNWTGNGKPFSKSQYRMFVDALNEAGILRQNGKDKSTGYVLTVGGKHALKRLISQN